MGYFRKFIRDFKSYAETVVYSLQRFRPFLFGLKFKLVTDCKAMEQTLKNETLVLERWALMIGEYDYDIVHRAGERIQHADALSRIYVLGNDEDKNEEIDENDDNEDFLVRKIMISQDVELKGLRDRVQRGEKKRYKIRDDILYRENGTRLQLIIPAAMITSVITHMYDNRGHLGVNKT